MSPLAGFGLLAGVAIVVVDARLFWHALRVRRVLAARPVYVPRHRRPTC